MGRVSNLEQLLSRLDGDPSIKDGIRDLVRFGLVFEDSNEEVLRMYGAGVYVGCRVDDRSPDVERFGTVVRAPSGTALDPGVRAVRWDDEPSEVEFVAESALVPIAKPGESVYSGLQIIEQVDRGGADLLSDEDKPNHLVIEGENLHALQTLRYTHAGKVDCIYIDPPYNTGGDLIYNDKYVAREDSYRHSKWLSFMERRLTLAKELLAPTGVIIVAIDDNEQAHLRLLMDEVFGAQNFIANVVWQGGRKNDSRYVSAGHDYMLIYAKSTLALEDAGVRWREEKTGVDAVLAAGAECWAQSGGNMDLASAAMRRWFAEMPRDSAVQAMSRYTYFLPDGTLCGDSDVSWPGGGGPRYEVLHPDTGLPVPIPERGWIYSTPERMQQAIDAGEVVFRADHTRPIRIKKPLADVTGQVAMSVFDRQRTHAGRGLKDVFGGEVRFKFPKDTGVLARWIGLATQNNPNAIILDFFGGSGSTAHAVMEMNAADGGNRQCILVTNNEVEEKERKRLVREGLFPGDSEFERHGIFQHVTYPRIRTVVTGIREDGSTYSDGLSENVTFARLTYTNRPTVALGRDFDAIAPLLWVKAGSRGDIIMLDGAAPEGHAIAKNYAVLFDAGAALVAAFVREVDAADLPEAAHVFVITNDDDQYGRALRHLSNFTVHRLYEDYLSNFEVTS